MAFTSSALEFRAASVGPRLRVAGTAAALAALIALAPSGAVAQQITWTGSTSDWGTNTNWLPSTTLANSGTYSLMFAGTPTALSSSNSLTSLTLGASASTAIRFDAGGFTLNGNAITLGGTIANFATTGTNTINLNMTVGAVRTVTGSGGSTLVLGGNISGAGGLNFTRTTSGLASFVLSGSNDFTGGLTVQPNLGVTITNTAALGRSVVSNTITIYNTGTLINNAGSMTRANNTEFNANGSTSNFNLAGGNLEFTGTSFITSGQSSGIKVDSGILTLATISGSGKGPADAGGQLAGTGTLVIKGSSSYSGNFRNANSTGGWTLIGDPYALGTGTIALTGGNSSLGTTKDMTWGSAGTKIATTVSSPGLGGDYVVTISQSIPGTGGIKKVGSGTLTLSGNNTYAGNTGIDAGVLVLSGSNAGAGNISFSGTSSSSATLRIENASALTTGTISFAGNGGSFDNTAGVPLTLTSNNNMNLSGSTAVFLGSNPLNLGTGTFTLTNNANLRVAASTLTFGGNLAWGAYGLSKYGAGTMALSGTSFTVTTVGGTSNLDLYEGVVRFDTASAVPTSTGPPIRLRGGVIGLNYSGTYAPQLGSSYGQLVFGNTYGGGGFAGYGGTRFVNLGGASATGTWGVSGFMTTTLTDVLILGAADADGTVDFQNPIALNGAYRTIQAVQGSASVAGILSGIVSGNSSSGIVKTGSGVLAVTNDLTYTGSTTISAGTLQVGNNTTTGSISSASLVSTSAGAALAFSRSDAVTYSGTVTGAGGFTQLGSGSLTLTGTSSYTGSTRVTAGTLIAGNTSAFGAQSGNLVAAGGVLDLGNLALTRTGTVSFTGGTVQSGTITNDTVAFDGQSGTISAALAGSAGLTKTGSSVLALLGTNPYTGPTTISTGTLQVGNGSTAGSIANASPVSVSSGAALAFNRSNDLTYSGTVTGAGGLTQRGGGALTLGAANTYTGPTIISSGTVVTGIADAISGSSAITLGSASARGFLSVGHNLSMSSLTFTGQGGDVNVTTGTVTFAAASGTAVINVVGGTNSFRPKANLSSLTRVDVAGGSEFTFENSLLGGSLVKQGAGLLALTGSSSLGGPTSILGGLVSAGNSAAFGTGTVTLDPGTALRIEQGAILANAIANSGTLLFAGGGLQRTSNAGFGTVAQLMAGGTAAAVALDPSFAWTAKSGGLYSDVLDLTNTAGTPQYLSLTYDPLASSDVILGWYDTTASAWVNAVAGNVGGTPTFYAGSWSSYVAANPSATFASSLGVYGRDTGSNTVWAVVNHNSDYAAIVLAVPEPGTIALAAAGLVTIVIARRRRRARAA